MKFQFNQRRETLLSTPLFRIETSQNAVGNRVKITDNRSMAPVQNGGPLDDL